MKCILILITILAPLSLFASTATVPEVVGISSATIAVHQPELIRQGEKWRLNGCLAPRSGAAPGVASHLDIVCFDTAGAGLSVATKPVASHTLHERPRKPRPHVRYDLILDAVPPGTVRIEVRAHQP
jgi:hypothetical protein